MSALLFDVFLCNLFLFVRKPDLLSYNDDDDDDDNYYNDDNEVVKSCICLIAANEHNLFFKTNLISRS